VYTHAHTHTYTHARTHAHIHIHTHTHSHTHTHIHARTHARTHTHTHSHTLTHTHTNGLRPCSKICCDLRICGEVSLLEDASVLQCAVVCCSVLQCAAVRCSHLTQGCLVTSRKSLFSVNLSFALHNGIVCGWKDSAQ